jgi:hypothetical protein
MKRLIYQVRVGSRRKSKLYDYCTDSVEAYAKRIGADYIMQREPILKIAPDKKVTNRSPSSYGKHGGFLPIYEKENAFNYLGEYDQIAIIDADVYVRKTADNIFDDLQPGMEIGAVVEREMPLTRKYYGKISGYSKGQYGPLKNEMRLGNLEPGKGYEFMNMGVMVLDKSILPHLNGQDPEQFLRRPEFKRFIDGLGDWKWSTDQTLLNYWIRSAPVKYQKLHWKWNGLFPQNEKIKDCHFVHFFLSDHLPNKGENTTELMRLIGES